MPMNQEEKRYGLIGEKLAHSHSPRLHSLLDPRHGYELIPLAPSELDAFLRQGSFDGLNVTIPYKQQVMAYCAGLSAAARRIGSANTIVRRKDGSLWGDNTDAYGFAQMARQAGVDFAGQKTLILGSGGTSRTAQAVIKDAGGVPVVISRKGPDNYENLERHGDATLLVNTTPVGMYPNSEAAPVDLRRLPRLKGVLDVVYNPLRTRLLMQAQELNITHGGGLPMLVWQAARARELFTGEKLSEERVQSVYHALLRQVTNLVLVGMPGCGKTTLGERLATLLDMPLVDIDREIVQECGCTISQLFAQQGEAAFRQREAEQTIRYGREGGRILVTGGGAVLRPENREALRMNGFVVHLTRSLEALPLDGRPLSKDQKAVEALWQSRAPLYAACADQTVANEGAAQDCAQKIAEVFHEALCGKWP